MNALLLFLGGICEETDYNQDNFGGNRKSHETVPFLLYFLPVALTQGPAGPSFLLE
jgi:hypothetical protein